MQTMTCAPSGIVATAATVDEVLQVLFDHGRMHPVSPTPTPTQAPRAERVPGAGSGMMESES